MNRAGLVLLQVVGGLTLLPYPFVLLANIMSIAAVKQTGIGALPFILLSFYPVVWIVLYVIAWRAMSRGATAVAYGLSSVPLLALLAFIGIWANGWVSYERFRNTENTAARKKMEPVNPLVWTIWSTAGDRHFPASTPIPVAKALEAIDANPSRVNVEVPQYGTPLKVAVDNLLMDIDGSPYGDPHRAAEFNKVVRSLVAHGAHLAPDEQNILRVQWRLRCALHDGPIATSSENPLVWRIITRKRDGTNLFLLRKEEIPLLNTPTELHGTPLYAALLEDAPDAYRELIKAGGRLSASEEQDPAAQASLQRVLQSDFELKTQYGRAKKTPAP